jgi:tripartite-type tricarboxylate transporter receptor subunit TctC
MFAPKGTPESIIAKMQHAASQVAQEPALRRQWIGEGGDLVGSTSAELAPRIRSESERWGKIIRANNIKLELRASLGRYARLAARVIRDAGSCRAS